MDQKRLFLAIAISVAILLAFQVLVAPHLPQPPKPAPVATQQAAPPQTAATPSQGGPATGASTTAMRSPAI